MIIKPFIVLSVEEATCLSIWFDRNFRRTPATVQDLRQAGLTNFWDDLRQAVRQENADPED
jgi:hypothetical protein